jgi:hypothetical protein
MNAALMEAIASVVSWQRERRPETIGLVGSDNNTRRNWFSDATACIVNQGKQRQT